MTGCPTGRCRDLGMCLCRAEGIAELGPLEVDDALLELELFIALDRRGAA